MARLRRSFRTTIKLALRTPAEKQDGIDRAASLIAVPWTVVRAHQHAGYFLLNQK